MLDQAAFGLLFKDARTYGAWTSQPVPVDLLKKVYDLAKMGPTSVNCSPMRIVFVQSEEEKNRLKPCLASGNVDKTLAAPVTAIIATDLEFYTALPRLFPYVDAQSWFEGNDALIQSTSFRNSTLQGAYFMLAARACGLDCGPMSGFDQDAVDQAFFPNTSWKSNFLCNLGYGDPQSLHPRAPRFSFDEVCQVI